MTKNEYLYISTARDIKNPKDRVVFRLLEMLPGSLSWTVLLLAVVLSWRAPFWISIFIIIFVIFWFLRTIYFSLHLWVAFKGMEKSEKIDWLKKLDEVPKEKLKKLGIENWKEICNVIVIPMYKESLEIVRSTFNSIKKSDFPKDQMVLVLACEEKAESAVKRTSGQIKKEFGKDFFKLLVTWHPEGVPGDMPGKGSNETYAAKKVKEEIIDKLKIPMERIIFSSFDADTCVFPKYFSCLAYNYLVSDNPFRTSFQPVPLYVNNIWQAPVISRIFAFSATFWHVMNQERPKKIITFSSHSMSFKTLVDVGFKQPNVVSDDSRIFWQCFLKYDGDYRVKPLYYPVSMDANVAKTFPKTLLNLYRQQRRWAYGVADIPYFLFGFTQNKKIPLRKKISLGIELIEGHFSWAVASLIIFFLGWLPIFLGGPEFSQTLLSYSLPKITSRILTVSMIGLITSSYLSFVLLPPKPRSYGKSKYLIFALGWFVFPVLMIFFTSFPALDAQTRCLLGRYMNFWPTEKFRKQPAINA